MPDHLDYLDAFELDRGHRDPLDLDLQMIEVTFQCARKQMLEESQVRSIELHLLLISHYRRIIRVCAAATLFQVVGDYVVAGGERVVDRQDEIEIVGV